MVPRGRGGQVRGHEVDRVGEYPGLGFAAGHDHDTGAFGHQLVGGGEADAAGAAGHDDDVAVEVEVHEMPFLTWMETPRQGGGRAGHIE